MTPSPEKKTCCEKCECRNHTKDHQFVMGDHNCDKANCPCHFPQKNARDFVKDETPDTRSTVKDLPFPQDLEGVVKEAYHHFAAAWDRDWMPNGQEHENAGRWLRSSITSLTETTKEVEKERIERCVGLMRQWLNEDRITDPKKMVDSKDLLHWIYPTPKQ